MNSELALGSWISLAHPAIAEIMAKSGFDWLAIDLEHSVITIAEAEQLIRVIDLCGVKPYVRLTSNDANQIKQVLDAGAHGIIIPMVKTKRDVEHAIGAAHYPVKGFRGVGLARAQEYGAKFKEYFEWSKSNIDIIIQIEHIDAVENLEEIFSVEGILGYILGPYDLSASMGIPGQFNHPDFKKALDIISVAARKSLVLPGIHVVEPGHDELQLRIQQGYQLIAYGVDIRMIDVCCRKGIKKAREIISEEVC